MAPPWDRFRNMDLYHIRTSTEACIRPQFSELVVLISCVTDTIITIQIDTAENQQKIDT